ncbi:MAG: SCO family protein, partial [Betaproteobacteria bacterium]|nr:SCO family protein [Betaproteobacteria bacterium]
MRSRKKPFATPSPTWRSFLPRFSSIIICSLLAALAACDNGPKFKSTDITGADYGKTLELVDQYGKLRTLEDFRGEAVVLFFGFTQCPDVCPTTMVDIANQLKRLGPDASRVQVLFVTVDPERDTPELLG